MATSLDELRAIIAAVAARTAHGVVRVGGARCGVIAAQERVLTVARIAREERVVITFSPGVTAVGVLTSTGPSDDLAWITVDTSGGEALDGARAPVRVGQPVFAVTPSGSAVRVTFGSVATATAPFTTSRGRRIPGTIEHTAPLPSGAAGSALVDFEGRLVAINVDRLGGGLYLAIPTHASLREAR
jgi:S1-C subfamily serine protease